MIEVILDGQIYMASDQKMEDSLEVCFQVLIAGRLLVPTRLEGESTVWGKGVGSPLTPIDKDEDVTDKPVHSIDMVHGDLTIYVQNGGTLSLQGGVGHD